jgi:hypothetical protein
MRDAILAAAGEAAETTTFAVREIPAAVDADAESDRRESAAREAGEAEGMKKGSASERARIKTIIGSEQAKGREDLANYFAFETEMSAEVVIAALAKSPPGPTGLDAAMAREPQPSLGPGGERTQDVPRVISTEEVYARRRAAVVNTARR